MVGISYDPKIDSFLSQVNQPVIGSVDGEWSAEYLYEIAKKAINATRNCAARVTIDNR